MSATICSIAITLISLLFLSYFSFIPLAIIAAILVYTAFRMVEAEHLIKLFRFDKTSFAIALLVAGITLYQDPIIGILVGIAIMLIIFMEQISHGYFEIHTPAGKTKEGAGISSEKSPSTTTLIYSFKGQLAYINGQAHIARFETGFKQYTHFILNLAVVYFIDIDGVDALTEIVEYLHTNHKKVVICGVSPTIYPLVTSSKTLKELEKKGLFFESSSQALEYLQHTEK
jgi:SulP family sulfate permease